MIQKLVFKLKIRIPLLRLPLFSHFWICKVERSQTHLDQESLPGFRSYCSVVVSSQKLLYIQYRIEASLDEDDENILGEERKKIRIRNFQ